MSPVTSCQREKREHGGGALPHPVAFLGADLRLRDGVEGGRLATRELCSSITKSVSALICFSLFQIGFLQI